MGSDELSERLPIEVMKGQRLRHAVIAHHVEVVWAEGDGVDRARHVADLAIKGS